MDCFILGYFAMLTNKRQKHDNLLQLICCGKKFGQKINSVWKSSAGNLSQFCDRKGSWKIFHNSKINLASSRCRLIDLVQWIGQGLVESVGEDRTNNYKNTRFNSFGRSNFSLCHIQSTSFDSHFSCRPKVEVGQESAMPQRCYCQSKWGRQTCYSKSLLVMFCSKSTWDASRFVAFSWELHSKSCNYGTLFLHHRDSQQISMSRFCKSLFIFVLFLWLGKKFEYHQTPIKMQIKLLVDKFQLEDNESIEIEDTSV